MLEKTGMPSIAQIDSVFPSDERLMEGPIAVIECYQSIPCNPCSMVCPRQAIFLFEDINDTPKIDNEKCNGCGLCIMKCPGLAIMAVDMTWSETHALIKLPYEFYPLPVKGQTVMALDREGKPVTEAEVINIVTPSNKTNMVSIAIDKEYVKTVRNIRVPENDNDAESSILCRCSDISESDIKQYIEAGLTSVDEIKRVTRLGMGSCQGRTCIPLVLREISKALNKPLSDLNPGTVRPMTKSMKLGAVASYEGDKQ